MSGAERAHGGQSDRRQNRPAIETALLPALFSSDNVGMISADADGLMTAVSPTAQQLLGYEEAELVGRPVHPTLHGQKPDGSPLPLHQCPMSRALSQGRAAEGSGEVLRRKDGTLMEIDWAVAPVILAAVRTGGVFAFYEPAAGAPVREHARIAAVEAANFRLALLADVTHVLLSSAQLPKGLAALAHLLVPSFADWVVVDLVDPETQDVERVALAHRSPDLEAAGIARLGHIGRLAPDMTSSFASTLRDARPLRTRSFPPATEATDGLERARLELFQALGSADAITAPLRTRHRTIGAVTAVRGPNRHLYQDADVALMTDIASRVAFAVENASLLVREERRSEEMQRELLPALPNDIEDLRLVGVYRPAADLAQVGGDWYDAFMLRDGSAALVIGDVAGHDVHAAARMGAARNKLLALAADRMAPPAEVLSRFDEVQRSFAPEEIVTTIYGRIAPPTDGEWFFEWSNAGHPPPLLFSPEEGARLLETDPEPPLGVLPYARTTHSVRLVPGSWLIFYTDGLIETRSESPVHGIERLLGTARHVEAEDIAGMCECLVAEMAPEGTDDVAVLGVAFCPTTAQAGAQGRPPLSGNRAPTAAAAG
ncbi:MAG TPA: SpoIIE family protein phosphatase [Acidimicrobiales bacterium]|nr:SpoIIE family protein phosphatase [Acidimicrobiales bacterium]